MHRGESTLWCLCHHVKRLQPASLGTLGLAAGECRNLPERGAVRMLVGSQLGDRNVGQDLAGCAVQPLRDGVAGVPQLCDVRKTASGVDVMDAGGAAPWIASRFRAEASARNQCRELLLSP